MTAEPHYTRAAPPAGFYVYLHRKLTTGEVFYVGKGAGSRAWQTGKTERSEYWRKTASKHGVSVEIVQAGMQEWWAFELERELIALYGRRDDSAGPLINMTDGGEASVGISDETRAKKREAAKAVDFNNLPGWREKMLAATAERVKSATWIEKNKSVTHMLHNDASIVEKRRKSIADWFAVSDNKHKNAVRMREIKKTDKWRNACAAARARLKDTPGYTDKLAKVLLNTMKTDTWKENHKAGVMRALAVPIVCESSGQLFESQSAAIYWLRNNGHPKASISGIQRALKLGTAGNKRSAYGHHWHYLNKDF